MVFEESIGARSLSITVSGSCPGHRAASGRETSAAAPPPGSRGVWSVSSGRAGGRPGHRQAMGAGDQSVRALDLDGDPLAAQRPRRLRRPLRARREEQAHGEAARCAGGQFLVAVRAEREPRAGRPRGRRAAARARWPPRAAGSGGSPSPRSGRRRRLRRPGGRRPGPGPSLPDRPAEACSTRRRAPRPPRPARGTAARSRPSRIDIQNGPSDMRRGPYDLSRTGLPLGQAVTLKQAELT